MRYAAAAMALIVGAGLGPSAFAQAPSQPAAPPATEPEAAAHPSGHTKGDPFEHLNRGIFNFNEAIDKALVEPTAKGYRAVTPKFFRSGVRNFLHNLKSPVIFINDVLQGSPRRAGATAGRFAINTTVGVLGLFDVAKSAGIESHDEDFGQTLGKWGAGKGPYLMLPLLGPTNVRDLTGELVDFGMDPLTYAKFKNDNAWRGARFFMDELTARTDGIDAIDSMRATAIDPYATTRSLYDQSRDSAISNGQDHVEDSPDSDDTLSQ